MSLEMTCKEFVEMCWLQGKIVHSRINDKYRENIKKMPNNMLGILAWRE